VHSRSITILSTEPAKMYFLENSSITAGCFVEQVDSDAVYPGLGGQTQRLQIFLRRVSRQALPFAEGAVRNADYTPAATLG
jgi:hypothetical protein